MSKLLPLPFSGTYALTDEPFLWESDYIAIHKSKETRKTYHSNLRIFADWLQTHSDIYSHMNSWPLDPIHLSIEHILEFRTALTKKYKTTTVRNRMASVTSYLTWLEGKERLPDDFDLSKLMRQSKAAGRRQKNNISEDVVNYDIPRQRIPEMLTYYDTTPIPPTTKRLKRITFLRDRAMLNVMFFTAVRLAEIVSINRNQVEDGQKQLIITGKGDKSRTIHLDDKCQEYIQLYLAERYDQHEALFVPHSRNTQSVRLSDKRVSKIVKWVFSHLGFHPKLSAHDIRHYRATDLLRRGVALHVIQEFLGHASIATTRDIYAPILGADKIASELARLGR